ncbi:MAG: hypothetical protein ACXV8O_00665 [Methylobacter sp.]
MLAAKDTGLIRPEDYLKGEPLSEVKRELIDGHVYATAEYNVDNPFTVAEDSTDFLG